MSDILIAQEVGTVVVIETAPAEIVEVVAVGPQGPVGDVNPQMPVILAATEAARDAALATIGTAALKANNLSDLASIPTALINLGLNNVSNTSDANKPISTATQTALNAKENTANKGVANGYAGLDATGKVPSAQLPSYVDDVLEFTNLAGFPATGEAGKIYVARDTNKTYRWSGSAYIYITSGAVDSVAGKTGVVSLVKGDVGLGNVDNTSDANKPISTATQTALNAKQDAATAVTKDSATGAAHIPVGTTAERPSSPAQGMLRRNSQLGQWEGYDGSAWINVVDASTAITLTGTQTLTNKTLTTPVINTNINYSGAGGTIQVNGVDKVTIGASGITAGSFAPNSIDAAAAALAFSGANQSLASNGYQKLPSGLIIQWGRTPYSDAGADASGAWPIAFPTAFVSMSILPDKTSGGQGVFATVGAVNKANYGFSLWTATGSRAAPQGAYFIAIGY